MKRRLSPGLAWAVVGVSGLLGCDPEPHVQGSVGTEIAGEIDDESLDQEPVRHLAAPDDDPHGKDTHEHGPDHQQEDVAGMQWADATIGKMVVPKASEGAWTLEVRAHVGEHRIRWAQGPFDALEVAEEALTLEPPLEAFVKGEANRPVRVMPRLVLRDSEGERITQLALPALVMQRQGDEVRFAQHNTMPVVIDRKGTEPLANADLPESL